MDYKYHHKALELLFLKKDEFVNEDNRGKTVTSPEILPHWYSAEKLSEALNISDVKKSRSILTSLRESDCLLSKYIPQKGVFFYITDVGISKYHEQYFLYKRSEQIKEKWAVCLKLIFYSISTLGIITSIVYNVYSTRSILKTIKDKDSSITKAYISIDSTHRFNQPDKATYKIDSSKTGKK